MTVYYKIAKIENERLVLQKLNMLSMNLLELHENQKYWLFLVLYNFFSSIGS